MEGERAKYHKAQISPLVQKIPVYVDTVRLAQIFGDQGADGGQVFLFKRVLVLDISQLSRELCCFPFIPRFQFCHSVRTVSLGNVEDEESCREGAKLDRVRSRVDQ